MNKDLLNQISAEEQPIAITLFSIGESMQVSPTFEWELETQLMNTAKTKSQPAQSWYAKILAPVGWAVFALCAVFALNWTIRSLIPNVSPASGETPTPVLSFEQNVRAGNICTGPLAVAHNYSVVLTNQDKTGFITLDEKQTIGELRSLVWSPDGKQLAIVGNTTGNGNIYLTDSTDSPLQPMLANSELGYLTDAAWSQDGKQLLTWSLQNNTIVYMMNTDGTGLAEIQLGIQMFGTPQFTPDGKGIIFYGADLVSAGLFEVRLDNLQTTRISAIVEDESNYAWSPDGTRLAYIEMDRNLVKARLIVEEFEAGSKAVLATLPILKSSYSIPDFANLSWSRDGKTLAFDFGRSATDRTIHLAYADGTGLVKLADSAHAPAFSADGNCLAYISNKQVFLLDLTNVSSTSIPTTPLLLADLPSGRSIADYRLDKLGWGLGTSPAPAQP